MTFPTGERKYIISEICGDWSLHIKGSGTSNNFLFFKSRNDAELVKSILEWEDAHPNKAVPYKPTLTPPNEPLTLDELRKMKDGPTYLKVFDPLLKSGWHIVKAVTEDKIIFRDWQTVYVPIDGMGVDYNLYRRPPEGKEDIK